MTWVTKKKTPKYRNKKYTVDGITFDSKKEGQRYLQLKLLLRAGKIKDLELQPRFWLMDGDKHIKYDSNRRAYYKADFRYYDIERGRTVVEDVKSEATASDSTYKLKKAIVQSNYGILIEEI